jgi:hypothetical protein
MSPQQKVIMEVLRQSDAGQISTELAVSAIQKAGYKNAERHTAPLLRRMVRIGLLVKTEPGIFKANK